MKTELLKLEEFLETEPDRELGNLEELKASIKDRGVLTPLTVEQGNRLIDGRRRYKVLVDLGIKKAPVYRIKLKDETSRKAVSLISTLHRKDLEPREAIDKVKDFHDRLVLEKGKRKHGRPSGNSSAADELGHGQLATGKLLGLSQGSISRYLRLGQALEDYPKRQSIVAAKTLDAMDEALDKITKKEATQTAQKSPKKQQKKEKKESADHGEIDIESMDRAIDFIKYYEGLIADGKSKPDRMADGKHYLSLEFALAEEKGRENAQQSGPIKEKPKPTPAQTTKKVEAEPSKSKKLKRVSRQTNDGETKGSKSPAVADTGDPKGEHDTASTTSEVTPPTDDKRKQGATDDSKKVETNTKNIPKKRLESKLPKESERQYRRLMRWKKEEYLSDEEVAEALEVPLPTARNWVNELKDSDLDLKEALDKAGVPEDYGDEPKNGMEGDND